MSPPATTASAASRSQPPANTERRFSASRSVSLEQVVGPVDRVAQRLVTLERRAAPAREQPEPLVEPSHEILGGHRPHPRRGQLDRQRDPVEAPTQLATASGVAVRRARSRSSPTSARSTNSRTASAASSASRRRPSSGRPATAPRRSARPRPPDPPGSSRAPTTLGHTRARSVDHVRDGIEEVLAVVEHQQQPLRGQVLEHRLFEAPSRRRAARPGSRPASSHTASGSVTGASSHNHAPSGNSATSSAATWSARRVLPTPPTPVSVTSGDHARTPTTFAISVSRPTNVVAWRGRFPGSASSDRKRREVGQQIRVHELEHPHRRAEVSQPVLTQIDETRTGRQPSRATSPRSRPTPAPARRGRPPSAARTGSAGGSRTRPAPASVPRPCAAPSAPASGPVVGSQASAASRRCASSTPATASGAEPNAAAIPSPIFENTTPPWPSIDSRRISSWRAKRIPHRVGLLLPQTRRALEIREEERHRPRRQLDHRHPRQPVKQPTNRKAPSYGALRLRPPAAARIATATTAPYRRPYARSRRVAGPRRAMEDGNRAGQSAGART